MQTSSNTLNNSLSHQTESNTTFHYSSDFLEWLRTEEISLAVSTYQTNKLFLIGRDTTKHLFVSERSFERAMGLHVESENSFYLSTRFLLWRFENALAEGQIHKEADKVYIPRQAFTTGDLDAHDISKDKNGDIVFVNTRYNCIAKISEKYNFKPLWMPPFITKMVSEDRCHLNGMAMRDGQPRYVTMVSQTDRLDAWREFRHNGGIVMDMETSEVLVDGLSMPHSPRYYQDKLWVLNAGRGEFGYIENNTFVAITRLDGFLRGLAFYKNYALIGLSKPRHERTFAGLPLEEILNERQAEPRCGIWIIDINTGEVVHSLESEGEIVELYDVQVLPNTKRPFTLDLKSDDITRFIAIEGDDDTVDFKALASLAESKDKFQSPYSRPFLKDEKKETDFNLTQKQENPVPNHLDPNLSATSKEAIKYQIATNISVKQAIQQFNTITFPRLDQQAIVKKFNEPLLTILANNVKSYIGAVIIELHPNGVAQLLSWYVLPSFRDLGIGEQLIKYANKVLVQNQFKQLNVNYRSDWTNVAKIEYIFNKNNFSSSLVASSLYKAKLEEVAGASWIKPKYSNQDIHMFLWNTLTLAERQEILQKQEKTEWYPSNVSPFEHEDKIEHSLSFGLKYEGKVVGWLITYTTNKDILEFSKLFVDRSILENGIGNYSTFLSFISNVIVKSVQEGYKYGLFQVATGNSTMIKFVNRYLRQYLITETDYVTTMCQLSNHVFTNEIDNKLITNATTTSKIEYKVSKLDAKNAIHYFDQLTFPRLSDTVKIYQQLNEPLLVLIAQENNRQIGAIVVESNPNQTLKIVSWYVLPPFRGQGIGKKLLQSVEKIGRKNNFQSINLEYRSDWTNIPAFEHLLEANKWEKPRIKTYMCKASADTILTAPWLKNMELPTDITIEKWSSITEEEKKQIHLRRQNENWFPDSLSPFQYEDKIDYSTSMVCRYKEIIIGWLITHRIKSDTIEFTTAFIDYKSAGGGLRKQSLFLPVLINAIKKGLESGAKYGIWQMEPNNEMIKHFIEKFLQPYLISLIERKFSLKLL
jgi:uncharacterized protein (TIGR03032 family)